MPDKFPDKTTNEYPFKGQQFRRQRVIPDIMI